MPIAIIIMAVLIAHELGHYFAGLLTGANAYLPIFIPALVFVIGITRVAGVKDKFKHIVAIAGPVAGVIVAMLIGLIALILGSIPLMLIALTALVYELWAGILGSDGRRYRKARKEMRWDLSYS